MRYVNSYKCEECARLGDLWHLMSVHGVFQEEAVILGGEGAFLWLNYMVIIKST